MVCGDVENSHRVNSDEEGSMLLGIMASWLAVGLVWCLALVKPEDANPGYFKSSLLVVLGLAVLAGISGWSVDPGWVTGGRIGVAAIAYAAFFCLAIKSIILSIIFIRSKSFGVKISLTPIFLSVSKSDSGMIPPKITGI